MNISLDFTFDLIRYIFSIAMIIHSIEFIFISNTFKNDGIWRYNEIKSDFMFLPNIVQIILNTLLKFDNFIKIIYLRIIISGVIIFYSNIILLVMLLIITLLISLRWRGTFNGGSDYMSIIILISLIISKVSPNIYFQKAAIYYLCFQVASSYFLAGIVKIKNKEWIKGVALIAFTKNTIYTDNKILNKITNSKLLVILLSNSLILWEILFPIALLNQNISIVLLSIGFIFHLINAYILGLNRFLIIWVSTYPAIIYLSQHKL